MAATISDEVATMIEDGVGIWLATADRERRPTAARVMGARFVRGRDRLALFVPVEQAGPTFANVERGSQVAVMFVRVTNYRAVQLKGTVAVVRAPRADESEYQQRYMATWTEACVSVGLARELMERLAYSPSQIIELDLGASFEQTPGPRAGAVL